MDFGKVLFLDTGVRRHRPGHGRTSQQATGARFFPGPEIKSARAGRRPRRFYIFKLRGFGPQHRYERANVFDIIQHDGTVHVLSTIDLGFSCTQLAAPSWACGTG